MRIAKRFEPTLILNMKKLITLTICSLFLISCGDSKTKNNSNLNDVDQQEIIIDIKTIIGKNQEEIEKILGKPESGEKVSPSRTPCKEEPCQKNYYKNNEFEFEIVFINDKADWITIHNVSNFESNEENITLLGLPQSNPTYNTGMDIGWESSNDIHEIMFFKTTENKLDYIYIKAYTD